MAEIDSLSLKISVDMPDDVDKRINGLTRAIGKLDRMVKSIDLGRLSQYVETLNKVNVNLANLPTTRAISKSVKEIENRLKTFETKQQAQTTDNLQVATDGTDNRQETPETTKELEDQEKQVKKTRIAWNKLFKSIGRIALYRAIRAMLKMITQSIATGLDNIRSVNKELDTSMKRLSQSGTTLKNSFASALVPVIQAIEPVITKIADGFANFVNSINEAKAAMSGASTYTKILTSDTEEYQKALNKANGSLLEFDKFTSLGKSEYKGVVSAQVSVQDEDLQRYEQLYGWLVKIKEFVSTIGQTVKYIWDNAIKPVFKGISDVINKLAEQELLKPLLLGILAVIFAIKTPLLAIITGITLLISNWSEMSASAKVATVSLLALAAAIIAMKVASAGLAAGLMASAIVGGIAAGVIGLKEIGKFANGGVPQTGTLFYAGEAGAEAVYNTSSGQSGVVNIEQFTNAMYNALVRYNAAQNGNGSGGNVYIDSTKVGQVVEKSVYNEGVRVGHFSRK